MITLTCQQCNEPFERTNGRYNQAVKRGYTKFFCGRPCSDLYAKDNAIYIEGVCQGCNEPFRRKANNPNKETGQYCSKRCSARSARPVKIKHCQCGAEISRRRTMCDDCRFPLPQMTLKELREKYSISQYHAKIRGNARGIFYASNPTPGCAHCGYDLHVDVCHIRAVADFPTTATIAEVNDLANLIGLCKNHHWEFDNGHLSI